MTISFIFFILLFCGDKNRRTDIAFKILQTEAHLTRENFTLELAVELTNSTNHNFILYGFKRIMYPFMDDSTLCAQRPGAGNAIFITDSLGNRMPQEFTLDIAGDYHYQAVTEETLLNVFAKIRTEYLHGKVMLQAKERKRVILKVDGTLHEPIEQLPPGKYLMYFVFYSGNDLKKIVDDTVMEADIKKHDAKVFDGWVKSNTITLRVD